MFNQLILTKSYIRFLNSGDGGIGRRTGLKILGTLVREGSSPSLRISHFTRNDASFHATPQGGTASSSCAKIEQWYNSLNQPKPSWFWHLDKMTRLGEHLP